MKLVGLDCKLYRSTTALTAEGAITSPVEFKRARDVTIPIELGEADMSDRESDWEQIRTTLKRAEITITAMYDTADAGVTAFQTALLNRTPIALAFMDGDITVEGQKGITGNFTVTAAERGEELEEGVTMDYTVKPHSFVDTYTVPEAP